MNADFLEIIQAQVDSENEIKDGIRAIVNKLEKQVHQLQRILNRVHAEPQDCIEIASQLDFTSVAMHLAELALLIKPDQQYRYKDMWSHTVQSACYTLAAKEYLLHERLVGCNDIECAFGVKVSLRGDLPGFHISIEDVLYGYASFIAKYHRYVGLPAFLSRLAVNCVIYKLYAKPLQISQFVSELYSGFQLLNMKNDGLRRRFDGIKYELKRIEEIVYDVNIRELAIAHPAVKKQKA